EREAPQPVQVVQPEQRRSAMPLILGGIIAAALGYFAARADILDPLLPPSMRAEGPNAELQQQLADTTARLTALEDQVASLPEPVTPDPVDLGPIEQQLAELGAQIEALNARPVTSVAVPEGALDSALDELRATAQEQQAEIAALIDAANAAKADAEAAANASRARTAIAQIVSALDTGAPFSDALTALKDAGSVDVPSELAGPAADGVVQLAQLQADIPDAARAALAAARSSDTGGGVGSFLQRQLGVRSVEAREGSDPDAVLSRVEAAVRAGDIGTALTEAQALPDPARDAMAGWLSSAQTRHDAVTAANALAERLAAL
ncbi:MAG: hypothetical protein AAFP16_06390, partial [Pseudomonadota bacterium]